MWSYKDGAISSVQVSVNLIGASSWLFCPKLIIALVESYLHRLSNSRNFYTITSSATTWKVSFVSTPLDVPACQTCWSKSSYGNGDLNSYINFNMNTSKNGALCLNLPHWYTFRNTVLQFQSPGKLLMREEETIAKCCALQANATRIWWQLSHFHSKSLDHLIKESCDFMEGSSSFYLTVGINCF